MLKTSLVACFNVDLAALTTGLDAATVAISWTGCAGLTSFSSPWTAPAPVRHHHQFRAMLVSRAGLLLTAEAKAAYRRVATDRLVGQEIGRRSARRIRSRPPVGQRRRLGGSRSPRCAEPPGSAPALAPAGTAAGRCDLAAAWTSSGQGLASSDQQPRRTTDGTCRTSCCAAVRRAPQSGPVPVQVLWGEIATRCARAPFLPDVPLQRKLALIQEALLALAPAQHYEWVRGHAFIALVHALLAGGEHETAYRALSCVK